jgi:bisanhydrobacterioruberin hydratase
VLNKTKIYLIYFLILVYVSGAIGILFNPLFFLPLTPYTLILTALVFLIHQPFHKTSYAAGFLTLILIGFLVEIIGVRTGHVFGNYYYGKTLGCALFGVPLVVPLNWAVLISCGVLTGTRFSKNRFLAAMISALVVTAIDFLMEQVVSSLDFWHFDTGLAGAHNYAGWLVISFVSSFILQNNLSAGDRKAAYIVQGLQVIFFGALNFYKLILF